MQSVAEASRPSERREGLRDRAEGVRELAVRESPSLMQPEATLSTTPHSASCRTVGSSRVPSPWITIVGSSMSGVIVSWRGAHGPTTGWVFPC
jgi:hypothetical protein